MAIVLEGKKTTGETFRKEIENNIEELTLAYIELLSIDLSPLRKMEHLEYLYLNDNKLIEVDLTPLQNCQSLIDIWISGNEIERFDLSPLRNCPKLEEVHLVNNPLMDILWKDDSIIPEKLPKGLMPFLEDIQSAVKK